MPSSAPFARRALTKVLVVGGECCADCPPGITRRRLNPDALEGTVAQNLAVGDAIERDAAGKTQIFNSIGRRESCASCAT